MFMGPRSPTPFAGHEIVKLLVQGLETFRDPDPAKGTVAAVRHRLAMYPPQESIAKRWSEAIDSIQDPQDCPMYSRLEIEIIDELLIRAFLIHEREILAILRP